MALLSGGMRQPRIKVSPKDSEAFYHCISRTVNGEWLFEDVDREIFRRQMWRVADFCGIGILTYSVLSNHFHILAHVPIYQKLSDAELLRRYEVLHPQPTKYETRCLAAIKADMARNGPAAAAWRKRQLAQMGDVSAFMKLLKQRYTTWFNKSHQRFGTLWAERFKSELVQGKGEVLRTVAAYIDLNCVRAGLVKDPKDYRFCGYAEAVAGEKKAQDGIRSVTTGGTWDEAQAHYRELTFGTGAGAREGAASIPQEDFQKVVAAGGKLPMATALRCRLRYFADGAVLGSTAFVAEQLAKYRQKTGRGERTRPRPMPAVTDWGDLATMRALRKRADG